jgi:hypothetical protein
VKNYFSKQFMKFKGSPHFDSKFLKMIRQKNLVIWLKLSIVDAFLVILAIFTKSTPSQRR